MSYVVYMWNRDVSMTLWKGTIIDRAVDKRQYPRFENYFKLGNRLFWLVFIAATVSLNLVKCSRFLATTNELRKECVIWSSLNTVINCLSTSGHRRNNASPLTDRRNALQKKFYSENPIYLLIARTYSRY